MTCYAICDGASHVTDSPTCPIYHILGCDNLISIPIRTQPHHNDRPVVFCRDSPLRSPFKGECRTCHTWVLGIGIGIPLFWFLKFSQLCRA